MGLAQLNVDQQTAMQNANIQANMDMTKSYDYVVKTYDKTVPITKKQTTATYQRERFSDEDNEKVNEIFDELDDDDFNPKKTIH